jgi:hypothetical protein
MVVGVLRHAGASLTIGQGGHLLGHLVKLGLGRAARALSRVLAPVPFILLSPGVPSTDVLRRGKFAQTGQHGVLRDGKDVGADGAVICRRAVDWPRDEEPVVVGRALREGEDTSAPDMPQPLAQRFAATFSKNPESPDRWSRRDRARTQGSASPWQHASLPLGQSKREIAQLSHARPKSLASSNQDVVTSCRSGHTARQRRCRAQCGRVVHRQLPCDAFDTHSQ